MGYTKKTSAGFFDVFGSDQHHILSITTNVNTGLMNPKGLLNWGGTISVAIKITICGNHGATTINQPGFII